MTASFIVAFVCYHKTFLYIVSFQGIHPLFLHEIDHGPLCNVMYPQHVVATWFDNNQQKP